jgi:3-methylfumaryl-CoA hydratase
MCTARTIRYGWWKIRTWSTAATRAFRRRSPRPSNPLGDPAAPWTAHPRTHPALPFRFSALTGNAHRIHYDKAYTTGAEGYPALVVQGPLLAMYLAELTRAQSADRVIGGFEFRLTRPAFVSDEIRVQGTPVDGGIDLAVVSGGEAVHASATAS